MIVLRIKEIAQRQGMSLNELQRETRIPKTSLRRLVYTSATGLEKDFGTLESLNLAHLWRISRVLGTDMLDLIVER